MVPFCCTDGRWNAPADIWSKWLWQEFTVSYIEWTVASVWRSPTQAATDNNVLHSTEVTVLMHVEMCKFLLMSDVHWYFAV